jgi:NET1-associated nuclear protein 1 (U3 small nucleolar RNA-associated protein 17)
MTARWQFESPHRPIISIKTHPSEETFALFHRPAPAAVLNTRITMLQVLSPIPQAIRVIPFDLLNFTWYETPSRPSSFNFVGITTSWSVVMFGDQVDRSQDDGDPAAKGIFGKIQQKRTLFQDIFGKSALTDPSNVSVAEATVALTRSRPSKEIASIIDGPAHLMPPLETLFTPLMETFLKPRQEDSQPGDVASGERNDPAELEPSLDDDVDMDNEEPSISGNATSWQAVSKREVDHFVGLFKAHAISSMLLAYYFVQWLTPH